MKSKIITIALLTPTLSHASVASEIREVVGDGSGFLGFILAGVLGYALGYPLLVFIFVVKFLFSGNNPIFKNAKRAASGLIENFVQVFLILFVFVLPFVSIIPVVLFYDWLEKIPFILVSVIYTTISLLMATVYTLRKGAI